MNFFEWVEQNKLANNFFKNIDINKFTTNLELQLAFLDSLKKHIKDFLKQYPLSTEDDIQKDILYKKYELEKETFNDIDSSLNHSPSINKSQIIQFHKLKADNANKIRENQKIKHSPTYNEEDSTEDKINKISDKFDTVQKKILTITETGDKKEQEIKRRMEHNKYQLGKQEQIEETEIKLKAAQKALQDQIKKLLN